MDLSGVTSKPLPSWFADIDKKREDTFNPRENWIYYRQGG
jgi:hypothetical protein